MCKYMTGFLNVVLFRILSGELVLTFHLHVTLPYAFYFYRYCKPFGSGESNLIFHSGIFLCYEEPYSGLDD